MITFERNEKKIDEKLVFFVHRNRWSIIDKDKKIKKVVQKYVVNEQLLRIGSEVRVISAEGHQIGVFSAREALIQAKENDLDLILITKEAIPPVCKMIDFGKFKYEESKKQKTNRHHIQQLKEVKISPRIQENDILTALKKINNFLGKGDKVKITCVFRAREKAFPDIGKAKLLHVLEEIKIPYTVEKEMFIL